MFLATLICSDESCAEEVELTVGHLVELDAAACDCGCTLVLLAVDEWAPAALALAA
jgi:hypothetical protein